MEEVWTLLLLSFAMLIGCYVAGSVPLAFTFSEEKLKLITVLGAGLLVGTALAVIIPEGVHTLYAAQEAVKEHIKTVQMKSSAEKGTADSHSHAHEGEHGHSHSHTDLHTFIGVALVLGFIFMLLVDQLSGGSHSHAVADTENGGVVQNRNKLTATIGLVVHAAADGIALGAAATTSQTHVEMIVFIAIMLHKAPAAFGLVSFLLHEGFDRTRIRKHLAVFSSAAPLLAVITYFGLSSTSKDVLTEVNGTGVAMLFSAGTFLYVATVHVLPELANMGKTTSPDGTVHETRGFTKLELTLMVIGALLPLFLALGHHH